MAARVLARVACPPTLIRQAVAYMINDWNDEMHLKESPGAAVACTISSRPDKRMRICSLYSLVFAVVFATTASAQDATVIRLTDTSLWPTPSPDPSAITFLPSSDQLLIADSEVNEIPTLFTGDNFFLAGRSGDFQSKLSSIGITNEPSGLTYNPVNGHVFIATDNSPRQIYEINPGIDGLAFTGDDIVSSFSTVDFGSVDAEGLGWDPVRGVLHLVDGVSNRLYTISPGGNGLFDGVPPSGDDVVTSFDVAALGVTDPEGVTFDPLSEQLYVIGKPKTALLHVTTDGQALRTVTLDSAALYKPAGLVVAPSSLGNGANSLYLVDRGVDNDSDPNENDGRLFEFALPPLPGNAPPRVTVAAPADDSVFTVGDAIGFAAAASDIEEGDLSADIEWMSDRDGPLGSGAAISSSSLSVGLHLVSASVIDGDGAQGVDSVSIRVASAGTTIVETRVASGADDAEQRGPTARVWLNSDDIELTRDGSVYQTVGLRFDDVALPSGATIEYAYIQFQADQPEAGPLTLRVSAQASDNAPPINRQKGDLSDRSTTSASVDWQPADWKLSGDRGPAQRTADLAPLVQELIGRPGWNSGQAMLFLVEGPDSGSAHRAAVAFETDPDAAALLHVRYGATPGPPNVAISAPDSGERFNEAQTISFVASAEDMPDGNLSDLIAWESNRDGTLGSGPLLNITSLSVGAHQISAHVTDSDGQLGEATVDIVIEDGLNSTPQVKIASPDNGSMATAGSVITLIATANDAEDGDVSEAVVWTSDLDGPLGEGTPTVNLSVGTHLLTAIAVDSGGAVGSDSVSVQINAAGGGPTTVRYRISAGADDAEERNFRSVTLSSSDLELSFDGTREQLVGLRFINVDIPQGAGILDAAVQFQSDESSSELAFLQIYGEDSGDAAAFTGTNFDLSSRPRAPVSVAWMPPPWINVGAAGGAQLASELAPIVQHIVSRQDWASGNDLALLIGGNGVRVAESFEGSPTAAAELVLTYTLDNTAPVVDAGPNQQIVFGEPLMLQGAASDDGQPGPPSSLATQWSLVDGPAAASFSNPTNLSTTVDLQGIGEYRIRLVADDGALSRVDELNVYVGPSPNNNAPVVFAGPNILATVGDTVVLSGIQEDDGLIMTPEINWSQLSGPGDAIFANSQSASTTVVFPSIGTYELELSAFDGELLGTGTLMASIVGPGGEGLVETAISNGYDDAEELISTGGIRLSSSDLELVFDGSDQLLGIRFDDLAIPGGAIISSARVQFTVDETSIDPTSLLIHGEASDDAESFTSTPYSISSRALTGAATSWSPPPWTTVGENDAGQLTPDLTAVVQEIINRSNWLRGNALVFIVSGAGKRVAESFDGQPDSAARLIVEFQIAN